MYEPILEKMDKPVYNIPEKRGYPQLQRTYTDFGMEICKEIKKEVFSL